MEPAPRETVSKPEPRRTSPKILGVTVVVVLEEGGTKALWVRVTPDVLARRSRATVEPVAVSVAAVGVTVAVMALVLVTLESVPDLSMMAAALPRSPVIPAAMVPVLLRLVSPPPASI